MLQIGTATDRVSAQEVTYLRTAPAASVSDDGELGACVTGQLDAEGGRAFVIVISPSGRPLRVALPGGKGFHAGAEYREVTRCA